MADSGRDRTTLWAQDHSPFRLTVAVLSLGLLIIGLLLADDYGASWDEHLNVIYGQESLKAFIEVPNYTYAIVNEPTGPGFFMLAELLGKVLTLAIPGWTAVDGRHFAYFATFVAGSAALLYILQLRLSLRAALAATLLYAGQPLFFGHAFMNPKDTPFMSISLIAVALGIRAFRRDERSPFSDLRLPSIRSVANEIATALTGVPARFRFATILLVSSLVLVVDVLVLNRVLLPSLLKTIYFLYHGKGPVFLTTAFRELAENMAAVPVENYMWKVTRWYLWARIPLATVCLAVVFLGWTTQRQRGAVLRALSGPTAAVTLAGFALGLATATRLFGGFFGALTSIFALRARSFRTLPRIGLYFSVGFLAFYVLRPDIWHNTPQRLITILTSSAAFQWQGLVLFSGTLYTSNTLPSAYAPHFFLLRQFTEPALALLALGAVEVGIRFLRGRKVEADTLAMLVWFAVPVACFYLAPVPRYDNFRHLFFVLPPLFLLVGAGFERLFHWIRRPALRVAVVCLALLPGALAIFNLHPYEYFYYNTLVGGVPGAFRRYELDYWCTSTREAMTYVNEHAQPGAVVELNVPIGVVEPFARPDLILTVVPKGAGARSQADLIVLCARGNADLRLYPDAEVLWQVEKQGAVLSVVKRGPGRE